MTHTFSNRQLKVGELIKHALAKLFSSGKLVSNIIGNVPITVSEVKMSADLKVAKAYVIPFGKSIDKDIFLKDLEENIYNIRSTITKMINMKYSPRIIFKFDDSFENVNKLESILQELKK